MGITIKYQVEVPNTRYVIDIAEADLDFERQFIAQIKDEFKGYLGKYLHHIKIGEPRAAAAYVYDIQYVLSILSMPSAMEFAEFYEERLHVGDMDLDDDFKKILKTVNEFLKTV